MRKRIFSVMLAACMVASLAGCGASKKEDTSSNTSSTVNKEISADEYAASITANADVYKQYVTLPTYTGVEVTVDRSSLAVTDDAVTEYINKVLANYATTDTVTEGVTANGDTIKLDYSGKLDGVAFSGGTATDATYTVGSGSFIDDLDKGLAGLTLGQEYDIPCTFPADYSSADLAGKAVVFTVTVSEIQKKTVPELTDQWVADNASNLGADISTIEEFKASAKTSLEEQAQTNFASTKYQAVWTALSGQIEPSGYPQEELDSLVSTLKSNVEQEYNSYGSTYGISDYDTYLSSVYGFSTQDDFNNYAVEYAQKYLLEKMALTMIAAEQNITVSADEINDMGAELAKNYGYDSYQAILDSYSNEMNAEVGYELLYQKVQEFLNNSAVEK